MRVSVLLVAKERPGTCWELDVLDGWWARLRGLLGTREDARPVVLCRCRSVHTLGMRYALDLAFVGSRGEVLEVRRAVPPGRLASCVRATCVLERPADGGPWVEEGQHLWVRARTADALGR